MSNQTRTGGGPLARIQCFSGAQLKGAAMLSMLCDHGNKALLYPNLSQGPLLLVSDVLEILGRLAFPVFLFFLVEGFLQTRSRGRYLGRMLLWAVISEVPFDLCATGTLFDPNWNNILFTFSLVLLTLWVVDTLRSWLHGAFWYPLSLLVVAGMCLAAMLTGVDYEHYAILIGCLFYLFRRCRPAAAALGQACMYKQPWALLGFGLILTYNGRRGRQSKLLNYAFYPAHLLLLGLLRLWLGL